MTPDDCYKMLGDPTALKLLVHVAHHPFSLVSDVREAFGSVPVDDCMTDLVAGGYLRTEGTGADRIVDVTFEGHLSAMTIEMLVASRPDPAEWVPYDVRAQVETALVAGGIDAMDRRASQDQLRDIADDQDLCIHVVRDVFLSWMQEGNRESYYRDREARRGSSE